MYTSEGRPGAITQAGASYRQEGSLWLTTKPADRKETGAYIAAQSSVHPESRLYSSASPSYIHEPPPYLSEVPVYTGKTPACRQASAIYSRAEADACADKLP